MPMTTDQKLALGQLGLQGAQGLIGGLNNSAEKDRERADKRYGQSRDDELFSLLLQALQNQSNTEADLTGENLQRSLSFSNANPLGSENDYRKSNTLGLQGLEALSGRRLARGTPSIASGFTDRPGVRDAYSDANVNEAIRQRRIATAGLDPRAAQEIGGAGSDYASQLFGDLQASQTTRRDNAQNAFNMIKERSAQSSAVAAPPEKKKTSKWKKIAKVAIPVAAIAAAPFTGGGSMGLLALGAGAGAASGALDGGWKGAGIGALTGGAAGYAGGKMGAGKNPAGTQLNNRMTSASFPSSMLNAAVQAQGAGQLLLPSSNNGGMQGFAQSVGQQRPLIQQALSRPQVAPAPRPQVAPQAPMPFVGPQQVQPTWAGRPTAMRAPTGIERLRDFASPVTGFLDAIGMPGASLNSPRMPMYSGGSPLTSGAQNPTAQVMQSPMGRVASVGAGLSGARGGASAEAEGIVAKLLETLKAYKGDQRAQQQIIELMQPYLRQIRGSTFIMGKGAEY